MVGIQQSLSTEAGELLDFKVISRNMGDRQVKPRYIRKFFQQNVGLAKPWGVSTPPADWHTVPDVMCDVLKRCATRWRSCELQERFNLMVII